MTNKADFPYLHGFSTEEQDRLKQQAGFSEYIVYQDLNLSKVSNLLEVGCGVGAQSEIILRRFPNINLTGIDLSEKQLHAAKTNLESLSFAKGRYNILQMNAEDMDFPSNSYDGAFLCWVLEHVPKPKNVLSEVRRVLKPGASVYITEVLNSSFFLDPYSPNVWKYWMAFNDYQFENSGDPFIGAKLGNLLLELGFKDIKTSVKTWHLDNRSPDLRKETIEYWTNLLMSAKDQLVADKCIDIETANEAYKELKNVARDPNAVFFYSFVQAQAKVF
jgi:ubiquinone/menaquinone biosynthesis C-methylase UbiE